MADPKQKTKIARLDDLLVIQGHCESKTRAKSIILAGKVKHGTDVLDKAGKTYPVDLPLTIQAPPPYVSRGGFKLAGFLDKLQLNLTGKSALDIGASTGGFTDCLLQRNVKAVTCVDVGRGQLHAKLVEDSRVTNIEKTNVRYLTEKMLPLNEYNIVVIDVSFISLKKILLPVWQFVESGGHLLALVKPQFEAHKKEVDKTKGIIKDSEIHQRVLSEIREFAEKNLVHADEIGFMESAIKGTDGNKEFLLAYVNGK